jgi:hypothetical protein
MIFKRRWFRILIVVLGLTLFVGYFAFATFLFAPHESRFKYDVAALVPRDVDFFLAKADLERDFDTFPRLAVVKDMQDNEHFRSFIESPEWGLFKQEQNLDALLRDLEDQVGQIPLGIDPLKIFGGKDLALAGRFQGSSFADADWAAYGRANWIGKLGVALLSRGWLPLDGIEVEREDGIMRLSGQQLARPLYLTRVRDVIVVGTSHELAASARDLEARSGEGSLLASADYNDNIATANRHVRRDEVEVIVDMRDLLANLDHQGELPDSNAQVFVTSFLGKVFQAPACKKVMGVLGLRHGLQMDLFGGLASERITEDQRSIYMRSGFSHSELLQDITRIAPEDCALFVYLHGPIDVLLKQVFSSMEPEMRNLLEENFRSTGEYNSLDQVVDHLASGLGNRLALIVAPNTYKQEVDGPPHDEQVVFMVSLVVWYTDQGKRVDELREVIGQHGRIFGLQGREEGSGGYFTNEIDGSYLYEFWNRMIPGTGVVATLNKSTSDTQGRGRTYVFNNHMAAGKLSRTYTQGRRGGYPRLSERSDFRALLDESLENANLLIWWNPQSAAPTLMKQAAQKALAQAESALSGDQDWGAVRRQVERDVLDATWPGKPRSALDQADELRFEELVLSELARSRRQMVRELAPQLQKEMERRVEWSQMAKAGLLMLQLDPREFRLSVRTVVPVD